MPLSPALQKVAAALDRGEWTRTCLFEEDGNPKSRAVFTASIGLQEAYGLPELVMFGMTQEAADTIIHNVAAKLVRAGGWPGGPLQLDGVLENEPVELRTVHPANHPYVAAVNIVVRRETGRPEMKEMVQIFWPGNDGRFPWDPEATDRFPDQKRLDIPIEDINQP